MVYHRINRFETIPSMANHRNVVTVRVEGCRLERNRKIQGGKLCLSKMHTAFLGTRSTVSDNCSQRLSRSTKNRGILSLKISRESYGYSRPSKRTETHSKIRKRHRSVGTHVVCESSCTRTYAYSIQNHALPGRIQREPRDATWRQSPYAAMSVLHFLYRTAHRMCSAAHHVGRAVEARTLALQLLTGHQAHRV